MSYGHVILLKVVPCPRSSCFIPRLEILLPYSYGKQSGSGLSSAIDSRLSRGINPACQWVRISGYLTPSAGKLLVWVGMDWNPCIAIILIWNCCMFRFLNGFYHFDVAIVLHLQKIFLGTQAQSLLISGTERERKNILGIWWSCAFIFQVWDSLLVLSLHFWQSPKSGWDPWEEDRVKPHSSTSLPKSSAACGPQGAFYFSPSVVQDESAFPHPSHCMIQPLWSERGSWELYL